MADEILNNAGKSGDSFRKVYDDTSYFIDEIVKEYRFFPAILEMMREGNASVELRKRFMLRAIDETWVNIVEDTLPALDVIIRNPSKFLEEREDVLPIELSKNITVRSLQHLSQHTNYISKIEGDKITPSKILNVYREETMQTYENKFINTLLNRLFIFVNRRYEIALKSGQDEKTTSLEFKEEFLHDRTRVNVNFRMEISEPADSYDDKPERNYTHTTELWDRVERLNQVVTAYANSDFVRNMGHSYIRPPVMRTNAILKNKNMRQCLALWQFIETYDNAGYSMLVEEDLEKVDDEYVKELYSTLALQYMIFRYNVSNDFDPENTLDSSLTDTVIKPRIISELEKLKESEFDVDEERLPKMPSMIRFEAVTPDDRMMLESIDVALEAADIMKQSGIEDYVDPAPIGEPEPAQKPADEPIPGQEEPEYLSEEPEETEEPEKNPIDLFSEQVNSMIETLRGSEEPVDGESFTSALADAAAKLIEKITPAPEEPEPEEESEERAPTYNGPGKPHKLPLSREIKQQNRAKRRARKRARSGGGKKG